jgi:hypothetical protein
MTVKIHKRQPGTMRFNIEISTMSVPQELVWSVSVILPCGRSHLDALRVALADCPPEVRERMRCSCEEGGTPLVYTVRCA